MCVCVCVCVCVSVCVCACVCVCCLFSTVHDFPEHSYAGVVPDLVTMGKGIGNGHPISAVVTSQKTAEMHDSIAPSIYPSVSHSAL